MVGCHFQKSRIFLRHIHFNWQWLDSIHIIEARMQEIIELVHNEIIKSGYVNKLVGGIVVTGGGSQLRNCQKLFQYMTGMDTRTGYPNEYLGKSKIETAKSPMYATTVGLVLAGFRALDYRNEKYVEGDVKFNPQKQSNKKSKCKIILYN